VKRIGLLVIGVSLFDGGSFARAADAQSNAPKPGAPAQKPSPESASRAKALAAFEKTLDTQDRVNRYFHDAVAPSLTSCWAALKGKGSVLVQVQYLRADSSWRAGESTIQSSRMSKPVVAKALECLKRAVRDTSFPAVKDDGDAKEFFVNWGLPIPWPKDPKEVVARMIDTGGGGRGECGPETPAQCWLCAYFQLIPGIPGISFCNRACVGYRNCTGAEHGCNLGPITPLCASGSPFGNVGGVVMY
jgi:hypothetical protein